MDYLGKKSGNKNTEPEINPQKPIKKTSVEQVKPKVVHQNKNVNDIQTNKKPQAKVSASNIITDFNKFEFDSGLRKLGGRAANVQSDISPRNVKSNSNTEKTVKSDFVSGPTANPSRIKSTQMMPVEEPNYNRSDICSDVSWGNQSFQPNYATRFNNLPHKNEWGTKSPDSRSEIMYNGKDKLVSSRHNNVARNPRFNPNFPSGTPKTMSDVTYQPKELRTHYNDPESFSYGGNSHQRKPTVSATARIPYSIDENEHNPTYVRDTNVQHKPKVVVGPQKRVVLSHFDEEEEDQVESDDNDTVQNAEEEVDEEIDELINMTEDESIQRKLLELHYSNLELLNINKSLEENINEQSIEIESFPSFDSLLKSQKEQVEHITSLENIIKDLISKLSDQETQIKKIKDENNESDENKKTRVALFYDPRNLPFNNLPRIIFDRANSVLRLNFIGTRFNGEVTQINIEQLFTHPPDYSDVEVILSRDYDNRVICCLNLL
ncbi:6091_t:CDS:2 [Funneliformis mosseae]|uniref:6091_t:CDS:1 n=1 Tax=Funneliformis mosseae TaxID=27381 RepID=A0A9N9A9Y7_FUNMO|nr:6091_t:CDS:2 [Funneliformis mosseae]